MTKYKKMFSTVLMGCMGLVMLMLSASATGNDLDTPEVKQDYVAGQLARLDFSSLSEERYKSVLDASEYAYMNLDTARSTELKEKILSARNTIIYSQGWSANGAIICVKNEDGTIDEVLPQFYEIFPEDWSIPTVPLDNANDDFDTSPNITRSWQPFFEGSVILSVPPASTNTTPFCKVWTSGFEGTSSEYYINEISTSGYRTNGNTYNIGYSNASSGASLGWKSDLSMGKPLSCFPPKGIQVAVRASSYTSPGEWTMRVTADRH